MSSPFEPASKVIEQRQTDRRWAELNVAGWRFGKLAIGFYLIAAILLPLAVGLLMWGMPS
jgi:hypothetical protein